MVKFSKVSKWSLAISLVFVGYLLIGFFALEPMARYFIKEKIEPSFGLNINIGEINTNPITFEIELLNIDIEDPLNRPYLTLKRLYTNLTLTSLFSRLFEIEQLTIEKPVINVVLNEQGEVNLLMPFQGESSDKTQTPAAATEAPLQWQINTLKIDDGTLLFKQYSDKGEYQSNAQQLNLTLYNLNAGNKGNFDFGTNYDKSSPVSIRGQFRLMPLAVHAVVNIKKLDLKKLLEHPQAKAELPVNIHRGHLSAQIEITLAIKDQQLSYQVSQSQLHLADLDLRQEQQPLFAIKQLSITDIAVDGDQQILTIKSCKLHQPQFNIIKFADASTNLEKINTAPASAKKETPVPAEEQKKSSQWQYNLSYCELDKGQVDFTDHSVSPVIKDALENIAIKIGTISSNPETNTHLTADMGLLDGGKLSLNGDIKIHKQNVVLSLNVHDRPMIEAQSYINNFTDLKMLQGKSDLTLKILYAPENKPQLSIDGDIRVKQFQSEHAITAEPLLAWEDLFFNNIKFTLNPSSLTIPMIHIKQSDVRIAINKQGQLNLLSVLKLPEKQPQTVQKESQPFPVDIQKIKLSNNTVRFSDDSLLLPFITDISKVNGTITPLQLDIKNPLPADVNLEGQINEYGEAKLKGILTLDDLTNHTDLKLEMKNIALEGLSPYSGTFSGYQLEAGKLDTTINYQVKNKQLDSNNNIVIRDIKLGTIIDETKASALPIKMAIALMKDNQGIIDIELPIYGDMNDPDFKYGHLVGQAIANLLTKIVAAPFNLLKKLGGGNTSLEYLGFTAGSAKITPPQKEILMQLATALNQRQILQLQIPQCVHETQDTLALKQLHLAKALSKSKQNKLVYYQAQFKASHGQAAQQKLKKKFTVVDKKSKDKVATLQTADYLNALEQRLLEGITLEKNTLKSLAKSRFQSVRDFLMGDGKLDKARLHKGELTQAEWSKNTLQCKFEVIAAK